MWAGPIGPAHMRAGLPFSWWPPRSTALDLTTGGGEDLTRVERTQAIGGEEHVRRRDLVRFAGPTHWGLSTEALAATFPQGGRGQRCPDRPRRHTVDTDVAVPQHLRQGEPQVHHRRFAGGVVDQRRVATQTVDRPGDDDRSAVGHVFQGLTYGPEDTHHVDVERAAQLLGAQVGEL